MTYVIGRVDLAIGFTLLGLIITAGGMLFNWMMSRSTNKLIAQGQELLKGMRLCLKSPFCE